MAYPGTRFYFMLPWALTLNMPHLVMHHLLLHFLWMSYIKVHKRTSTSGHMEICLTFSSTFHPRRNEFNFHSILPYTYWIIPPYSDQIIQPYSDWIITLPRPILLLYCNSIILPYRNHAVVRYQLYTGNLQGIIVLHMKLVNTVLIRCR